MTESGFAAEMGYEKFWNLKCRYSGLTPDAAVLVATVRALKYHGGAPQLRPGQPLPEAYTHEDLALVEAGCVNLLHHLGIVRRSGVPAVVCLNRFHTDTQAELDTVRRICEKAGARVAVSDHWARGGEGALELADAVLDACRTDPPRIPPPVRLESAPAGTHCAHRREVYGADGVDFEPLAAQRLAALQERPDAAELGVCMVKTQYSLSDDPSRRGVPASWRLHVRDALLFGGAGLVVPVAGDISLMPGTAHGRVSATLTWMWKRARFRGCFSAFSL